MRCGVTARSTAKAHPYRSGDFRTMWRTTMAANRRTVTPKSGGGGWTVEGGGPSFMSSTYKTQAEAEAAARADLMSSGGGELVVKGENGRVRSQDTIGRPDPRGSKG
jgi:hypothetical protein